MQFDEALKEVEKLGWLSTHAEDSEIKIKCPYCDIASTLSEILGANNNLMSLNPITVNDLKRMAENERPST